MSHSLIMSVTLLIRFSVSLSVVRVISFLILAFSMSKNGCDKPKPNSSMSSSCLSLSSYPIVSIVLTWNNTLQCFVFISFPMALNVAPVSLASLQKTFFANTYFLFLELLSKSILNFSLTAFFNIFNLILFYFVLIFFWFFVPNIVYNWVIFCYLWLLLSA